MTIVPLIPDVAVPETVPVAPPVSGHDAFGFGAVYAAAASSLERAQQAESQLAQGQGSILAASTARAESEITLGIASAASSRLTQALSTFANMSV